MNRATAPLNAIYRALGERINTEGLNTIKSYITDGPGSGALKSSLESTLDTEDTSGTISDIFGIAKTVFVLVANILVTALELVLYILKGILKIIQ